MSDDLQTPKNDEILVNFGELPIRREYALKAQQDLRLAIWGRDVVKLVAILVALSAVVYTMGETASSWPMLLLAAISVFGMTFAHAFRWRHHRKPSRPDDSLPDVYRTTLTILETRIRVVRHEEWSTLMPFFAVMSVFTTHHIWTTARHGPHPLSIGDTTAVFLIVGIAYLSAAMLSRSIYRWARNFELLNLRQQQQELLAELRSSGDEVYGRD